jgi:DMSO/TMAO reductase YedYZ heme-binding membrane subunit
VLLILGLLQSFLFLAAFHRALKRHPNRFYVAAAILSALLAAGELFQFNADWPEWAFDWFLDTFYRGSFATALFLIVMFIGALDAKKQPVRSLMGIRAEMSILASILTLGHNLVYGWSYFPALITNPSGMRPEYAAASVVTLALLLLMIPLFITSFPSVRRRMPAKKWKRLQRWAYPFYFLIYVHVMILFIPRIGMGGNYASGAALYTVVYALYLRLRLRKALRARQEKAARAARAN